MKFIVLLIFFTAIPNFAQDHNRVNDSRWGMEMLYGEGFHFNPYYKMPLNTKMGAIFNFKIRLGTESYTYEIPEICTQLGLESCNTQLQEYIWGPGLSINYDLLQGSFELGLIGGVDILFSFNEGTTYKERAFILPKVGSYLKVKLTETAYFTSKYLFIFNYRTREPHQIGMGFEWQI